VPSHTHVTLADADEGRTFFAPWGHWMRRSGIAIAVRLSGST
jgi:hypothetical protein